MKNSERFLDTFNKLENFMKKKVNENNHLSFNELLDRCSKNNKAILSLKKELKTYAKLRNAIVHNPRDKNEEVIAEPNTSTVEKIEHLHKIITSPPKVFPDFKREVLSLSLEVAIETAISNMYKNSFSQIPINQENKFYDLLTNNTIARWLGKNVTEDLFSLKETSISTVLESSEHENTYQFIHRNTTYFDVLDIFEASKKKGELLDALLITETGKQNEKLLGIITLFDIPNIIKKVVTV